MSDEKQQEQQEEKTGFAAPNYTQTPNDFFPMIPLMDEAELKITLVMIRQTFGFHRKGFKMSLPKLARETGLSRSGALIGAKAAEKRGTFRRVNPDEPGSAEWELVVADQIEPEIEDENTPPASRGALQPLEAPLQPVEGAPLVTVGQLRVKESSKRKSINKKIRPAGKPVPQLTAKDFPSNVIFREVTERWPAKVNWTTVESFFNRIAARLGRYPTAAELKPFYEAWCGCGWNTLSINWLDYAVRGQMPAAGKGFQNGAHIPGVAIASQTDIDLGREIRQARGMQ
jgi:hypothetical protein